jgi:CubicO group peptidase (beta-lactamase class C family)
VSVTRRHVLGIGAGLGAAPLTAPRTWALERPEGPPGLEDAVDALVQRIGAKPFDPGLAVLLIKSGRVLLMKGYGLADLRSSTPISPWTRFEIASVSKTFTATALLMLQQRGLFRSMTTSASSSRSCRNMRARRSGSPTCSTTSRACRAIST